MGEIESTIQSHPAVKQAIVIAVSQTGAGTETSGEKQLRAYVVPHHNAELQEQALTSFLKQQLPSYMIPGEIVILEALPLNDVGKVDRNQLLLLQNKSQQDKQSANARDELEAQLVQIWQEVFNKQPIGIYDSFFDLGGHSLLAVQLFDCITKITGRHLPLATLFQTPTIEALAIALRQQNWSPDWKTVTAIRPGGSLPPLFVIPPAASTVLRFAPLLDHLDPDLPVYGLQHRGLEDEHPPFTSVKEIAQHFVEAIQSHRPAGPYLLTGICFGAHVAFEVAQQLAAKGEKIALLAMIDAAPPANGPNWSYDIGNVPKLEWHKARWRMLRQNGAWVDVGFYYLKIAERRLRGWFRKRPSHEALRMVHHTAQRNYQADYYAGSCLLLQSEEFARRENIAHYWKALVSGNFKAVVIPNSNHVSLLLSKLHLQELAEALMINIKQSLYQSDAAQDSSSPG